MPASSPFSATVLLTVLVLSVTLYSTGIANSIAAAVKRDEASGSSRHWFRAAQSGSSSSSNSSSHARPSSALHRSSSSGRGSTKNRISSSENSSNSASSSSSSSNKNSTSWLDHPAVFTLSGLGLWETSFFGRSSAGLQHVQQQREPAGRTMTAPDATLLQHWWRLQCRGSSNWAVMDLRGVGSAYSAQDAIFLMQLQPKYITPSLASVNLTEQHNGTSWTLQQSEVRPDAINAWHVEAQGLSSSSSYKISAAGGVSKHSYGFDASRCSQPPQVFRPGSVWSVITEAHQHNMSLYAQLVAEHTSYHQVLGMTGAVLFLSRPTAAALMQQPVMQPGLAAGAYVLIVWDGDVVPSMPYYYQYLWYNLVLLATWGTENIRLSFIDLDEFYVLPMHLSFQEAFAPGGCLQAYQQARVVRTNAYYGVSAADALACQQAAKSAEAVAKEAAVAEKAAKASAAKAAGEKAAARKAAQSAQSTAAAAEARKAAAENKKKAAKGVATAAAPQAAPAKAAAAKTSEKKAAAPTPASKAPAPKAAPDSSANPITAKASGVGTAPVNLSASPNIAKEEASCTAQHSSKQGISGVKNDDSTAGGPTTNKLRANSSSSSGRRLAFSVQKVEGIVHGKSPSAAVDGWPQGCTVSAGLLVICSLSRGRSLAPCRGFCMAGPVQQPLGPQKAC